MNILAFLVDKLW